MSLFYNHNPQPPSHRRKELKGKKYKQPLESLAAKDLVCSYMLYLTMDDPRTPVVFYHCVFSRQE